MVQQSVRQPRPIVKEHQVKMSIDIDDRVATEVMGWRRYDAKTGAEWCEPDQEVGGVVGIVRHLVLEWSPSTRIDHAWEVVEKLSENWQEVEVSKVDGEYRCGVHNGTIIDNTIGYQAPFEYAETAPMAICLVALQTVEK